MFPTGVSNGPTVVWSTMNWVKPTFGCPAACVKNWPGVSTEHSGVSELQVPACQPSSLCGGLLLRGDDAGRLSHRRARCKHHGGDPRREKTPSPCNQHTDRLPEIVSA